MRRLAGLLVMGLAAMAALTLLPASRAVDALPMAGAAVFAQKGCPQCHGPAGMGTEKGPSLAGVGRKLDRAHIERQIREGGGAMPAFGEVLTEAEVTDLGAWLETRKAKSLQREKKR